MVRMRFAAQALDELRKLDPETPVTLRLIKQLMRTGAIPSVPVGNGNRRLLNLDALVAYLENPPAEPVQQTAPGIRRIDERGLAHSARHRPENLHGIMENK